MSKVNQIQKLSKGDKVAILSPSNGLPGLFPWVQDLGLERLKDVFHLIPVEYPTTRKINSSLKDRAEDVMSAFKDPEIKAIFTSIGGSDQIKLIKYLDKNVILKNAKPFFGFSDNTHLHIFLSSLGIPSYYGGSIMTQLAMQGNMMDLTVESLNRALFDGGELKSSGSPTFNDIGLSWADRALLSQSRELEENEGLIWSGDSDTSGILWGGCIESMIAQCTVGKYLPSKEDMEGKILFLESAENIPPIWSVRYLLMGLGERGWFNEITGIMIGRPKAWDFSQQKNTSEKNAYKKAQQDVVLSVVREYNNNLIIVQNVDFGHTDPQIVLPVGGHAKLSPANNEVIFNYT